MGLEVGSYSFFCSRANMLLFFTLDARLRFSKEDRFLGDGEVSRFSNEFRFSVPKRDGETESRLCQYWRGEFARKGGESRGDDSVLKSGFCKLDESLDGTLTLLDDIP